MNTIKSTLNDFEIIKNVLDKTLLMLNDINSFVFLRSYDGNKYIETHNLGGGNYLCQLGLMSILSMLTKSYYILDKGWDIEQEIVSYKDFVTKLKNVEVSKDERNKFLKEPKYINESLAFLHFIRAYKKDLGLNNKSDDYVIQKWSKFRDVLIHLCRLPNKHYSATYDFKNHRYSELLTLENINLPFIIIEESENIIIQIDEMAKELPLIKDWLIEELHNGNFDNYKVQKLLKWYKENELI